jgi:hypothetical protein
MVSISVDAFRRAFSEAVTESDPAAAARAQQVVTQATENLNPDDTSARAQVLRGITTDSINRNQSS